jgi:hypothetical protein
MISNPFSRKPKNPVDQALDAFDGVRADAAGYAATIRDAAADIADTLTEIGPPAPKRRLPVIAAVAAAGLGIAYLVRNRLADGAPGPVPEVPGPPAAAPTATATAARTTAEPATAEAEPASPGDSEPPKEPKAETAESSAGNGKPADAPEAGSDAGAEKAEDDAAEEKA